MKSSIRLAIVLTIGALLAPSIATCEVRDPAADVVQWNAHSKMEDGRQYFTDGKMVLDSQYIPNEAVPSKAIPAQNLQRLFQSNTDREFSISELGQKKEDNNYVSPSLIQLNRKYVDFLRKAPFKSSVRFRAKGLEDPVLILDGEKVVGVMMPMKRVVTTK